MGYTHYWENNIDGCEAVIGWESAIKDCKKIIKASPVPLIVENDEDLCFNGVESDGHEEFYISYHEKGDNFCKTAAKPYDIVVVAVLSRLAELDGFDVHSDGESYEWIHGVKFASKVLCREVKNPIR